MKKEVLILLILFLIPIATAAEKEDHKLHLTINQYDQPLQETYYAKIMDCDKELREINTDIITDEYERYIMNLNLTDVKKNCIWQPTILTENCNNNQCTFKGEISSELKLAIYIPEQKKVLISKEVRRAGFESSYEANIEENKINIKSTTPTFSTGKIRAFMIIFLITIITELLIAMRYTNKKLLSKRVMWFVLMGNVITIPLTWFLLPLIGTLVLITFIIGIIISIIIETAIIYYFCKEEFPFDEALLFCLMINVISVILTSIAYYVISLFFVLPQFLA
jgi:hypothetical protein